MKKISFVLLFLGLVINAFSQDPLENTVLNIVNSYPLFEDAESNNSKVNSIYEYLLNDNTKAYLVFTTSDNHSCHACGAKLSVFIFNKSYSDWVIKDSYIGTIELGTFGMAPEKDNIKTFLVKDVLLIAIKGHSVSQGLLEEYVSLYAPYKNKISYIGGIMTGYDDSGMFADDSKYERWKGQYFFLEKSDSFPDILVNITGTKDNSDFSKVETYTFDGEKYIKK
jgi:hypothetical protein